MLIEKCFPGPLVLASNKEGQPSPRAPALHEMGCIVSESEHRDDKYNIQNITIKSQFLKQYQPELHYQQFKELGTSLPQYSSDQEYVIFLGQSAKEKNVIFGFDVKSLIFYVVPQPSDIQLWNYSSVLYLSPRIIFILGGLNAKNNLITSDGYIYNDLEQSVLRLPNMVHFRYTAQCTFLEDRVYIMGGRQYGGDDKAIIPHCEVFNLLKGKWESIASLNIPRCTGFAIVWKGRIYLFGGLTGIDKRSRKIEAYDPKANRWEVLPFKLYKGVECGVVTPGLGLNEFYIFGGNTHNGSLALVNCYNLQNQTIHAMQPMLVPRMLQKGLKYKDSFYNFGGSNDKFDIEQYSFTDNQWCSLNSLYTDVFQLDSEDVTLEKFSCSQKPCYIPSGASEAPQTISQQTKFALLFGTDEEPFILMLNLDTGQVTSRPVPLKLRLYKYQGGYACSAMCFYLFGGVTQQLDKISQRAYLYDPINDRVDQLSPMVFPAYAFPTFKMGKALYLVGGRREGTDAAAVYDRCQRFNLETQQWQEIAPLNHRRMSCNGIVYQERLIVFGGQSFDNQRPTQFESYTEAANQWQLLDMQLNAGLEAFSLVPVSKGTYLILGGCGNAGNTDQVQKLNMISVLNQMCPDSPEKSAPEQTQQAATKLHKLSGILETVGSIGEPKALFKIHYSPEAKQVTPSALAAPASLLRFTFCVLRAPAKAPPRKRRCRNSGARAGPILRARETSTRAKSQPSDATANRLRFICNSTGSDSGRDGRQVRLVLQRRDQQTDLCRVR